MPTVANIAFFNRVPTVSQSGRAFGAIQFSTKPMVPAGDVSIDGLEAIAFPSGCTYYKISNDDDVGSLYFITGVSDAVLTTGSGERVRSNEDAWKERDQGDTHLIVIEQGYTG